MTPPESTPRTHARVDFKRHICRYVDDDGYHHVTPEEALKARNGRRPAVRLREVSPETTFSRGALLVLALACFGAAGLALLAWRWVV